MRAVWAEGIVLLPEAPAKSQFRDVPATGEAGRAINVLASRELAELLGGRIVNGTTSTTFDPTGRVTRAQMGSFIARTLEGVFEVTGVVITDRGNCGRDGTVERPFCSIQKGIDTAATMRDRDVQVRVRPRPEPYSEELVVASGQAFRVNVTSATQDLVLVDGSGNGFPWGATLGTVDGRRAIVPAAPRAGTTARLTLRAPAR